MKIILKDRFQQPWYLYHIKMAVSELLLFAKNFRLNFMPLMSFTILACIISLFIINFEKISSLRKTFDYSLTFYFKDNLSEEEIKDFQVEISKFVKPTSSYYSSKETSLRELYQLIDLNLDTDKEESEENEEDNKNNETSQFLPAYIKISYEKEDRLDLDEINSHFKENKNIERIISSGETLEKLNNLIKKIVYVFTTLITILLVSIIINYTNSLKIFFLTERKKLRLYYLIGTQIKFIKIPICYRAFWQGLFGAMLGIVLSIILSNQFSTILLEFTNISSDYIRLADIFNDKLSFPVYIISSFGVLAFVMVNFLIDFLYKKYQYNYW